MNRTYLGFLLVIFSALVFASTSLFTKLMYAVGMDAWNSTFIMSSFSLVLVGFLYLREAPSGHLRPKASWQELLLFALCGAGSAIFFNLALFYLSISLSTIFLFTYPAFTAVMAWLILKQRPTRLHIAALLLTLAGAVLTANIQEALQADVSLIGIALAVLTAVSHALYLVMGERVAGALSPMGATLLTRVAILGGVLVLNPRASLAIADVRWEGWAICFGTAVIAGVAPFFLLNRGIALIGANRAAIASVAELPFALALGLLFQGDIILPMQWMGAVLITIAVLLSQYQTANEGETDGGPGTGTAGSV